MKTSFEIVIYLPPILPILNSIVLKLIIIKHYAEDTYYLILVLLFIIVLYMTSPHWAYFRNFVK